MIQQTVIDWKYVNWITRTNYTISIEIGTFGGINLSVWPVFLNKKRERDKNEPLGDQIDYYHSCFTED